MTVQELIALLRYVPMDAKVVIVEKVAEGEQVRELQQAAPFVERIDPLVVALNVAPVTD